MRFPDILYIMLKILRIRTFFWDLATKPCTIRQFLDFYEPQELTRE